jgi:RNA polymerase sigma factor (sigma-70 family)
MYYFALQLSKNKPRAEDIAQSALLRAVKYFPNFAKSQFGTATPSECEELLKNESHQIWLRNWLMKIVKNVFLNDASEMEKWSRLDDIYDAPDSALISHQTPQSFDFPLSSSISSKEPVSIQQLEAAFFEQAADDDLKKILQLLNSKQKSVLFLIAEGYSYKEVASILEMPIGTVMSTLSRCLSKIRSEMSSLKSESQISRRGVLGGANASVSY